MDDDAHSTLNTRAALAATISFIFILFFLTASFNYFQIFFIVMMRIEQIYLLQV